VASSPALAAATTPDDIGEPGLTLVDAIDASLETTAPTPA